MNKLISKINRLKTYHLFSILGIVTLFPLILISFFNNPGSDDFDMAYESQIESYFELQFRRYNDWSGRYFSNGLISFDPLTYNNFFLIKIVPIILLLFFVLSLYFFISSLKILEGNKQKIAFVGLITFLYIYQIPDICEGFYWIPGSLTNVLPTILSLFYFSFVILFFKTSKYVYYFISLLFLVAAIGCSELTVVLLFLTHTFLIGYNYFILKNINKPLIILFLISLLFSAIEILAPGNSVRGSLILVKHQFIYSVLKTIQFTFLLIFKWLPIIILCFLFLISFIIKIIKKVNTKYLINPIYSILLIMSFIFGSVFSGYWSLNSNPPNRSLNTLYLFFIFGTIYFFTCLIHYFINVKKINFEIQKSIQIAIGLIILSLLLSNNVIITAYQDLFSLKAYKYDKEMKARFKVLANCKTPDCVLKPLTNMPTTIFTKEDFALTTDKNNWKNLEIARYYRKKSIIIESVDTVFTE
jgi:hypothetical protein